MNRKGVLFATLSIFLIGVSMFTFEVYKDKIWQGEGVDDAGIASRDIIDVIYEHEEMDNFLKESVKNSIIKGVIKLAENGGRYNIEDCVVDGIVVWDVNCKINEYDLELYFNDFFKEYIEDYGLNFNDFEIDFGFNKIGIKLIDGRDIRLSKPESAVKEYIIKPEFSVDVDYDFSIFYEIETNAKKCLNMLSTCGNNDDFDWETEELGGIVKFKVITRDKLYGVKNIDYMFGLRM